jgi:hypothetical protein
LEIKNFRNYVEQIEKRLREKGINVDLFRENITNGIRDGPLNIRREIQRIQGEFFGKLYHYSFKQVEELARAGYPQKEIEIAAAKADSQKEAVIAWIEDNYWRLIKLRKELENAKEKKV